MTAERYTVVFTGLLSMKKPGEYLYLSMSSDPFGVEVSSTLYRGRPPYERMGHDIPFEVLPEGCRRLVLDVYRDLWNLKEEGEVSHPRGTLSRREPGSAPPGASEGAV